MSRRISRKEERILRARKMVRLVEAALFAVYYADASSKYGRSGQKFRTARERCSDEEQLNALLVLHRDWWLFACDPKKTPCDEDKAILVNFQKLFEAAGVEVPPVEDDRDEEEVVNPRKAKKPAAKKPKKKPPVRIPQQYPSRVEFLDTEKRILRDALRTAPPVTTWRDLEARLRRVEPKFGVGGLVFSKIVRRFSLSTVLQVRGISETAIAQLCTLAELPKEQFGDGAMVPAVTSVFRSVEVLPAVIIVAARDEPPLEDAAEPEEPELSKPQAVQLRPVTRSEAEPEVANLPQVRVSAKAAALWRNIRRLQMVLENWYNWPHGVGVPTRLCIEVVNVYYNTINSSQHLTQLGYAGLLRLQPGRLNQGNHLWEALDTNVWSRDYTTDVGIEHLEQWVRAFLYNNRSDVLALFPDVCIPKSPYKTA